MSRKCANSTDNFCYVCAEVRRLSSISEARSGPEQRLGSKTMLHYKKASEAVEKRENVKIRKRSL